jgi:hypothetical protein
MYADHGGDGAGASVGYATGAYSSRKMESKTCDDVAFLYLSADAHPDHNMLAGCESGIRTHWRVCSRSLVVMQEGGVGEAGPCGHRWKENQSQCE